MLEVNYSNYNTYSTDCLTQWDTNQTLKIKGLGLKAAPTVLFSNRVSVTNDPVTAILKDGFVICDIPNGLLTESYPITAYIRTTVNGATTTICKIKIPIIPGLKPDDYVYIENISIISYETLVGKINSKVDISVYKAKVSTIETTISEILENGTTQEQINNSVENWITQAIADGTIASLTIPEKGIEEKHLSDELLNQLKQSGYITDTEGNKYTLGINKDGELEWTQIYEETKTEFLLNFDVRNANMTDDTRQYITEPISGIGVQVNNALSANCTENGIRDASYESDKSWPIDLTAGYTIETAFIGKTVYPQWYTILSILNQVNIRLGNTGEYIFAIPYYTKSALGSIGTKIQLSNIIDENGNLLSDLITSGTDFVYIAITVTASCEVKIYINGVLCATLQPTDFDHHISNLTVNEINSANYYLRLGTSQNGSGGSFVFSYFNILNGVLTHDEIKNNYKSRYLTEIKALTVYPESVSIYPYAKMPYVLTASPKSIEYELEIVPGDESISVVSGNLIEGRSVGETTHTFKAANTDVSDSMEVKIVETLEGIDIVSKREISPTDITVINPPDTLNIGDSWVLLAYLLPYEPKNDNLIVFTSDNPAVCSVEYGVLTANGKGSCTITATGVGTEISTSFTVTVKEKIQEVTTLSNTYYIPLPCITDNGFLNPNNDNAVETTHAIIDILAWAKEKGYRKIVFPKGEYLVTPEISESPQNGVILMPDNMIVDFSGSIINIKPTKISKTSGYTMFKFDKNIRNTILCNADIRGDRYTNTTEALNEQCCNVSFGGAIECGIENCSIGNSGGFNVGFGRMAINNVVDSVGVYQDNIEAGTFNDEGNPDDVNTSGNWRTINKIRITPLHGYFELGTVWGYAGYQIPVRLYDILIYNEAEELLEVKRNCRVFYRYDLPEGYYYAHVVLHQEAQPTGSLDVGGIYRFYSLYEPYKCFMRNCRIHDNYSTGIAACGGKHWTLDGLIFENNGVRDPACHVDYEDGWESAFGDVWKNCYFDNARGGGIILVSGNGATFVNNEIKCKFDPRVRSENWRVFHNILYSSIVGNCQTDTVIAQNILLNSATITDGSHYHGDETQYETRIIDNY